MGSPADEQGRDNDEGQHEVTIARFAIGRHEVTFDQWDACVTDGGCKGYRPDDKNWGRGDRPVISVNWGDARSYVDWLSELTDQEYRLPSEAEWEYAARAGTTTRFWWGDDVGSHKANCDGCGSRWDNKQTAPVSSFDANEHGLYDTAGNVWEWVEDCWNVSYEGAPENGGAWTSGQCDDRVLRGGSWNNDSRDLRSANRFRYVTFIRLINTGFRVARTLP